MKLKQVKWEKEEGEGFKTKNNARRRKGEVFRSMKQGEGGEGERRRV